MIEHEKAHPGRAPKSAASRRRSRRAQTANERVASILAPPELKPAVRQVGPLKMNNQPPKVLYETVGKLAGMNVLFDPQYTPPARNFNVELGNSTRRAGFRLSGGADAHLLEADLVQLRFSSPRTIPPSIAITTTKW